MKLREYRLLLRAYAACEKRRVQIRWYTVGRVTLGTILVLAALANAFGLHAEQPYPAASLSHFSEPEPSRVRLPVPTVSALQTSNALAEEAFARPDQQPGWGTASGGQVWQADAVTNASLFSVHAGAGVITGGQGKITALLGPRVQNVDVLCTAEISTFRATAANVGVVLRYGGPDAWLKAHIDGSSLMILRHVGTTTTTLASLPFEARASTLYRIRFEAVGPELAAKVWDSQEPEPTQWMLRVKDMVTSTGNAGIRVVLQPNVLVRLTQFLVQPAY